MSTDAIKIVGFLALFIVVYAIFYKPVIGMLDRRTSSGGDSDGAPSEDQSPTAAVTSEGVSDAPHRRPVRWHRDRLVLFTLLAVFLLDQASKYLVKTSLPLYESWPEEGIFRITHGINSGTAFGLFPNQTFLLIIASVLAIGFIYYFYRAHALPSRLLRVAIGLQLGGAGGNLLDRIRSGAVVDFIDVGWWPVFNIADSSIVSGIGLLVAVVVFSTDKQPERGSPDASGGPGP